MERWAIGLLCLLVLSVPARADYTEGSEYDRISPPETVAAESGKVEVVEVFWYGCPHCYDFEPYVEKWLKSKPDVVEFVRMPATLNPSWVTHARAFYALQAMGEIDRAHKALFQAIHEQGRTLFDADSIARFLAQLGIDPQAFRQAYNSPEVQAKLEQVGEQQLRYAISGVPSVIIDGQYRTSASQAGSYEEMLKVIDFLIAKATAS
ncbi:MAG: thiol:disulfide interchange protein DsbA/DsbL [Pseudomonadota bacterium]|jgi:protein dithiol oxidoreductase (disulfide-forming)|nr:thiol:disulfide interchange protein DsbA/DsbL [Pseudomonadota bacterium]